LDQDYCQHPEFDPKHIWVALVCLATGRIIQMKGKMLDKLDLAIPQFIKRIFKNRACTYVLFTYLIDSAIKQFTGGGSDAFMAEDYKFKGGKFVATTKDLPWDGEFKITTQQWAQAMCRFLQLIWQHLSMD
jgi:hypothetical protein